MITNEFFKDGGYHPVKIVDDFNNTVEKLYGKSKYLKLKFIPTTGYLFITGTISDHPWFIGTNLVGLNKLGRFNYGLNKFSNDNFEIGKTIVNNCNKLIKQKRLDPLMNEGLTIEKWLMITGQKTDYKVKIQEISQEVQLTFNDIYVEFLKYFQDTKKGFKSFQAMYANYFKKFDTWLNDNTLFTYDNLLKWFKTINHCDNKINMINILITFLKYKQDAIKQEFSSHLLVLEKYKKEISSIETKKNNSYVPSDSVILDFFKQWEKDLIDNRYKMTSSQNQSSLRKLNILKIMAIYGLRCHEIIYILNWSDPVLISSNEFVEVPVINNDLVDNFKDDKDYLTTIKNSHDRLIPAITDPDNTDYELVIGNGKTGKRIAFPSNKQWLNDFNLLDYKTLKDCIYYQYSNVSNYETTFLGKNKDGGYKITMKLAIILSEKLSQLNFPNPFTSHKLRHATVIRNLNNGINTKASADSLGHCVNTHLNTYGTHASQETKYDNCKEHFNNHKTYQQLEQELKQSQEQNLFLTKQNEQLTNEVNQLKQELTDKALNIISINR